MKKNSIKICFSIITALVVFSIILCVGVLGILSIKSADGAYAASAPIPTDSLYGQPAGTFSQLINYNDGINFPTYSTPYSAPIDFTYSPVCAYVDFDFGNSLYVLVITLTGQVVANRSYYLSFYVYNVYDMTPPSANISYGLGGYSHSFYFPPASVTNSFDCIRVEDWVTIEDPTQPAVVIVGSYPLGIANVELIDVSSMYTIGNTTDDPNFRNPFPTSSSYIHRFFPNAFYPFATNVNYSNIRNYSNSSAYQQGYQAGYTAGDSSGYSRGYAAGVTFADGRVNYNSASYGEGFNDGEEAGYTNGYSDGYSEGYVVGDAAGIIFADGRVNTLSASYTAGYSAGFADGEAGGSGGYQDGYDDGYADGISYADSHVNTSSASYSAGLSAGFEEGTDYGYSVGYAEGYDNGVDYADTHVNTSSASYISGYNQGYDIGIYYADNNVNVNSASYQAGIDYADSTVNENSASFGAGVEEGVSISALGHGSTFTTSVSDWSLGSAGLSPDIHNIYWPFEDGNGYALDVGYSDLFPYYSYDQFALGWASFTVTLRYGKYTQPDNDFNNFSNFVYLYPATVTSNNFSLGSDVDGSYLHLFYTVTAADDNTYEVISMKVYEHRTKITSLFYYGGTTVWNDYPSVWYGFSWQSDLGGGFNCYNILFSYTFSDGQSYSKGYSDGVEFAKTQVYADSASYQYVLDNVFTTSASYVAGYYNALENASSVTFNNVISSAVDVPLITFRSLLNFDFLGINLMSFVLSLLTLGIIIGIIKLFLGGK